ncbi:hypothetical protein J6590_010003 [Homalodisca vitripennis]|nr:hypothetical protein J6590_010003 [Homalodisca vitripennis]
MSNEKLSGRFSTSPTSETRATILNSSRTKGHNDPYPATNLQYLQCSDVYNGAPFTFSFPPYRVCPNYHLGSSQKDLFLTRPLPPPPHIGSIISMDCCDVIFEKDLNAIKIMTQLCEKILSSQSDFDKRLLLSFQQGKLTKEIVNKCNAEVHDKCNVDITDFLNDKVRLGRTYQQMLSELRSLNSSFCLKVNFGISPGLIGAPRRMRVWEANKNLRQERPPHLRPHMMHPALREKGRAIPHSHIVPRVMEKEAPATTLVVPTHTATSVCVVYQHASRTVVLSFSSVANLFVLFCAFKIFNTINSPATCEVRSVIRKLCSRWVPKLLTENCKNQRFECAMKFLIRYHEEGDGFLIFDHAPYSPELALRDYHLFLHLKQHLSGNRYNDDDNMKTAVNSWLSEQPLPMPGMRPPMGGAGHVVPAPKGSSTMGIIMPLYTIGIVIFFMYTMMKIQRQSGTEAKTSSRERDKYKKREKLKLKQLNQDMEGWVSYEVERVHLRLDAKLTDVDHGGGLPAPPELPVLQRAPWKNDSLSLRIITGIRIGTRLERNHHENKGVSSRSRSPPSGTMLHTLTSKKKEAIEIQDSTTLPNRDRHGKLQYNKFETFETWKEDIETQDTTLPAREQNARLCEGPRPDHTSRMATTVQLYTLEKDLISSTRLQQEQSTRLWNDCDRTTSPELLQWYD